jgi:4-amino-4-deoxy-L-arabinose transferase-like glycosyltransferase
MQLAAPFCIGMLGWYAWYETDKKFWLFDLYFFNGAATLAKGPVAPFLALAIIFAFIALRREWSLLRRTIWVPGILLYLAMVLPWFIAVTRRNPQFLRVFFLEHNLERFATNLYEHEQPVWFYLVVMMLALLPWTVIAIRALVDAGVESVNEWRARLAKNRYVSHARWGDAFPEFLVLWTLFPIVFFSLSRSKLPGYILPSIPPLAILTADYLNRLRQEERGIRPWLLVLHALLAGVTVTLVLLLPWFIFRAAGGMPPVRVVVSAIVTGIGTIMLILVVVGRFGVKRLRIATMVPLVMLVFFLFGVGPFFGLPAIPQSKRTIQLVDLAYSARPLAQQLTQVTMHDEPVAVLRLRRDLEFGLSFYRDHRVLDYEKDGVPGQAHILVVRDIALPELRTLLATRSYHPLFAYPAQHVSVYQVDALGTDDSSASPHK